ncbi:DUF2249 domain-containing protein [Streptomyces sp. TP-A0874]|uniref:DUF2249 domain-containing protein n=1 Tax=Streptomyces sp. TP-A0874 TaxID=549819 RepID=UPI000A8AB2D1|nr:DUF2249 domain-containing protein [Streptomyces sp. TP-A0874]
MTSASEIYIQATETDPAVRATSTLREVHQALRTDFTGKDRGGAAEDRVATLRRYLAGAADALYAPASGAAGTRLLVRALRSGAAALEARLDALSNAADPASATAASQAVAALLDHQLTVEETVLVPALAELPGVDLARCVADLETVLGGGRLEQPDTIDVREIPHGQRHPTIFARFARLAPGEGFVLVNNHDPKPLRREFEATHPAGFTWDYLESGPERWQVRIGRAAEDA